MTRILRIDRDHPDPALIAEAARVIREGGLVAFPTETVYGLAANAHDESAVRRIFEAKGRPPTNPLIVHAADIEGAKACVSSWPESAEILARAFWPGPISLVLPRAAWVPDLVTAGKSTVGVRVPLPVVSRHLIEAAGCPLAAPSANRSTGISPSEARHVLKDLADRVDLILDAGPAQVGLESTVVDLSGPIPILLRPGGISVEAISQALGGIAIGELAKRPAATEAFSSPGQMEIHYAPRTATWMAERSERHLLTTRLSNRVAVLVLGDPIVLDPAIHALCLSTPELAANRLYASLHELDEGDWEAIMLVAPPDRPEWRAIRDRIRRAGQPISDWPRSGSPS